MKASRSHMAAVRVAVVAASLFSAIVAVQDSSGGDVGCSECIGDSCCSTGCSCDLWTRSQLTGDWLDHRSTLAESGITFDADLTQFYQGVTSGGLRRRFHYGGHGDYVTKVDFGKLMGREGLFLQMRAEHRFGSAVNLESGGTGAVAVLPNLPTTDTEDLILTNMLFTQALSERFIVFAGKMDTLDGDMNAFAHGRGKHQFFNTNFVFNPIAVQTIPYATLGAGFSILQGPEPIFTFSVLNATDTSTTIGVDELFADGVALAAEARLPTSFMGLPGHQGMGATWNSKTYTALGQDPRVIEPGVPITPKSGSWSLRYNFDQYLYVDPCNPQRGWGLFGRAGISDGNPNPLKWNVSCGVGGNSPLRGREADRFGIGWYYSAASNEFTILNPDDGTGAEIFYNIAVSPWFNLTPDVQIIDGSIRAADTALVFGLRGNLSF